MEASDERIHPLKVLYEHFVNEPVTDLSETMSLLGSKENLPENSAPRHIRWSSSQASNGFSDIVTEWGGANIVVASTFEIADIIYMIGKQDERNFISDILYIPQKAFSQRPAVASAAKFLCDNGNVIYDDRKDAKEWSVDFSEPNRRIVEYHGEPLDEETSKKFILAETYLMLEDVIEAGERFSRYTKKDLESQYIWENVSCGLLDGFGLSSDGIDYELYSSVNRYNKVYQRIRFGLFRCEEKSIHEHMRKTFSDIRKARELLRFIIECSLLLDMREPFLSSAQSSQKEIAHQVRKYCADSGISDFIETAKAGVPIEDILA